MPQVNTVRVRTSPPVCPSVSRGGLQLAHQAPVHPLTHLMASWPRSSDYHRTQGSTHTLWSHHPVGSAHSHLIPGTETITPPTNTTYSQLGGTSAQQLEPSLPTGMPQARPQRPPRHTCAGHAAPALLQRPVTCAVPISIQPCKRCWHGIGVQQQHRSKHRECSPTTTTSQDDYQCHYHPIGTGGD
jgi:hypothetical protein